MLPGEGIKVRKDRAEGEGGESSYRRLAGEGEVDEARNRGVLKRVHGKALKLLALIKV